MTGVYDPKLTAELLALDEKATPLPWLLTRKRNMYGLTADFVDIAAFENLEDAELCHAVHQIAGQLRAASERIEQLERALTNTAATIHHAQSLLCSMDVHAHANGMYTVPHIESVSAWKKQAIESSKVIGAAFSGDEQIAAKIRALAGKAT